MRIQLEKMRKPIGTRDSPARTCKDLSHGHSKLEDGESGGEGDSESIIQTCPQSPGYYWVDPNLGMVDDAVKVYCNMTSGETCVYPDIHTSKMPNIPWRKSGRGWYSQLRGGFKVCLLDPWIQSPFVDSNSLLQITYDSVGPIQMRFLRLLSGSARQNFTYTCINSVVWYDALSRNYQKSITFLGDNEEEFSAAKNKPNVPHDGCRVWDFTKPRAYLFWPTNNQIVSDGTG